MIANRTIAVTGGNGYIALQIIKDLLSNNFNVVATVRDANNKEKTQDLQSLPNQQNLKIVTADLFNKDSFIQAFQGVDAVIHNASTLYATEQTEEAYVKPAIEGITNVFDAVLQIPSIKNLVQISSMAAVCGAPGSKPDDHVFSSNDWSDPENQRSRKAFYALSKTLQEQKCWTYKDQLQKQNITLSVVCPTLVIGPYISQTSMGTNQFIVKYLTGEVQEIANSSMSLVDVRDISLLCQQAIVKNAPGRFIGVNQGFNFEQIAGLFRKTAPQSVQSKIPTKLAEGKPALPSLFENKDTLEVMGRPFIPIEQTFKDLVENLVERKFIQ